MILNEVNFFSETLVSCCTMNVLLPQRALATLNEDNPQPFRVLYLLHGHSDDNTAWMRFSSIESYVEGLNLAVIMPDGQNSFYTDMAHGGKFFTFMTEEVPAVAKSLFPLSSKREDTFIAGPSMGGYGAYKLAFSRPEQYAAAASLSGALDIAAFIQEHRETNDQFRQEIMEGVFGDLDAVSGSSNDLFALAPKVSQSSVKPRLFQCCGTEDYLYKDNTRFRDYVQTLGFDYTYEESPGEHSWDYWDMMIKKVLNWLPLK